MLRISSLAAAMLCTTLAANAMAESVTMYRVDASGASQELGQIEVDQSNYGVVFTPKLEGLVPGAHGFHLHANGSCKAGEDGTPAAAAGGHFDPMGAEKHGAPWGDGHLGDLPALYVSDRGLAEQPVLAPRLTLRDLEGKALMIHQGGDNYSDSPEKLGGGGARVACGVFE